MARYVAERQWHPSQVLAPLLTGELDLTLTAPVCPELRRWILSHGKEVEVREPASLRTNIRREWLAALRGPGGRAEAARVSRRGGVRAYPKPAQRPALAAAEIPVEPRRPQAGAACVQAVNQCCDNTDLTDDPWDRSDWTDRSDRSNPPVEGVQHD